MIAIPDVVTETPPGLLDVTEPLVTSQPSPKYSGLLPESIDIMGPASTAHDDALILLSKVAVVNWSQSSMALGDLSLRIQNTTKTLVIEILDKGLKTNILLSFDDIELVIFDAAGDRNENKNNSMFCGPCGEKFANATQCESHQKYCPLYAQSSTIPHRKMEKGGSCFGLHLSLKRCPSWWTEQEVDPMFPLTWVRINDLTGGELRSTGQLSLFTRPIDETELSLKLAKVLTPLQHQTQKQITDLETGNGESLINNTVIKHFVGYGHFRGVIQSYDKVFFSVLYADGDYEDVEPHELHDLLTQSLPPYGKRNKSSANRRRSRHRALQRVSSHPKCTSRVGTDYQADIEPFLGNDVKVNGELWDELWVPPMTSDGLKDKELSVENQCKRLRLSQSSDQSPAKTDTPSQRPLNTVPRYSEVTVLSVFHRCGYDECKAAQALSHMEQDDTPRPWTEVDISNFTALMVKHNKSFREVQLHLSPPRTMAEVLQFYYSSWKHSDQYRILKPRKSPPPSSLP
mmetsp:Transcript_14205/g.18476  ORF Transcript_14205/g.18476 Transcript_14205/m.18476 type:complete len:515 (-) Transcript_14205:225-1769(-)